MTRLGAVVVGLWVVAASAGGDVGGQPAGPQEAEVLGVFASPLSPQPAVVLRGKRDGRTVAMVIGPAEATGIALPLRNLVPPRPLTHDLFVTLFGRLKVLVQKVVITDLREDIYYATVFLGGPTGEMQLDSRPSDAIALAIRTKAPVYVEDRVFEKSERVPRAPAPGGSQI